MNIDVIRQQLRARYDALPNKTDILKAPEFKELFQAIPKQDPEQRAAFGQRVNALHQEFKRLVDRSGDTSVVRAALDVTAPMDENVHIPEPLAARRGSVHPISREITVMSELLERMGFRVYGSREIDDQYHMFETLNFPKGHPARDDYDTFMTVEKDKDGDPLIAPAHTSTMQNRILRELKSQLEVGEPIAATSIDRVFRNEDVDPRHEHTFHQHEGIYVDKDVHTGMLVATLQAFLEGYFGKAVDVRVNPFYFPFTEPSFEFSLSCPFCDKKGCAVCSHSGWIELLGCGMIHPNVLKAAGIDPAGYKGFAWGGGVERLVMMKYGVEDVRHFHSAKLDFLRQF